MRKLARALTLVSGICAAAALVAASAAGCEKTTEEAPGGATAEEEGPAPTARPAPVMAFEGKLDYARLEAAKKGIKPFQPWDEAERFLLEHVGKPTSVDGKKSYWHLLDGDKCHELVVENDGGKVGMTGLGSYDEMMKSRYARCLPGGGEDEAGPAEPTKADEPAAAEPPAEPAAEPASEGAEGEEGK